MSERLVLRHVKRVNEEPADIIVEEGRIAGVTGPGEGQGERVFDCEGCYVSSGWIDLHVHAFPELDPYGDEIDEIGVKQGVTTIVDAGRLRGRPDWGNWRQAERRPKPTCSPSLTFRGSACKESTSCRVSIGSTGRRRCKRSTGIAISLWD
ncbi:hypothetical protein LJK88_15695 [Paenibacillus sp. P26]|nr:hypothetical protein LJK88_15695 [Paenibacillus sp. P26]